MAEEVRFFLRTAAYSVVISVVYWFASYDPERDRYDWAGTVMLVATALAAAAVVAVLLASARRAHGDGGADGSSSPLEAVGRLIGFADPTGEADDNPLSAGLDPVPIGSAWPVAAGIGAVMVAMGLVFGPWLLLPGLAVTAAVAWGWITQFDVG